MSTTLHVLLKDDPSFEGNVADDKTATSACHQLGQVSVLQYFQGMAGLTDTYFRRFEGLQTLPVLKQGPVGQALGCLYTGLASFLPQVPK